MRIQQAGLAVIVLVLGLALGLAPSAAAQCGASGGQLGPCPALLDTNRNGSIDPHEECDRTPLDMLIEKERWSHLNDMLSEFTDKDRTFVELYYQRGMEADEIAAEMQISLKTVYSKKHKIRAHLVRCLERLQGSPIADLAAA